MRVFQGLRLSSSTCRRPQNDSITALSYGHPMAPIEGERPASRTFWLNAQDVNWVDSSGRRNTLIREVLDGTGAWLGIEGGGASADAFAGASAGVAS